MTVFLPFSPFLSHSPQKASKKSLSLSALRERRIFAMAMAFLPAALAGWTKPRTLQQQQEYERSLEAESSLQPEPPPASTRRWDVLMIAVDDLRSELSCSGPKGFDTHPVHTPHLCDLAKDSLMLLRSQARPRAWNHAFPALTSSVHPAHTPQRRQVTMATCGPSRASILTSRHPSTTRVFDTYSCERFPFELVLACVQRG